MKRIAIFASGSGSNAENLALYFKNNPDIEIAAIYTNNAEAGVIGRASRLGIPSFIYSINDFKEALSIVTHLQSLSIDAIILAGFLRLISPVFIQTYKDKIVNIHPALLPKYGGKGMYGMHVHREVIKNNETESGITIHLVNEKYDEGTTLFQEKCDIDPFDTPELLAEKIHELEYKYLPIVIENWIHTL